MALSKQTKIQHLYWRAGFGIDYYQLQLSQKGSLKNAVERLFKLSENYYQLSVIPVFKRDGYKTKFQSSSSGEVVPWMEQMQFSVAQLREKMSFFWHDHFACHHNNPKFRTQYIETLRYYGLGKFKDLLVAVSKSSAMLDYLNNQQNKKSAPNENFARELLELFTLGIGNYSEKDIKEAARAFTGWGHKANGEFVMRRGQHDKGSKEFLGQSGNFSGEDIIDILLKEKRTAQFISEKVYRFFVNENGHPQREKALAESFYASDYDIGKLMKEIFLSDWFYDVENVAARIKSPIELVIGVLRAFKVVPRNWQQVKRGITQLGQTLLKPPNVAGWTGGRAWIDNSTLLARMELSKKLFNNSALDPKRDIRAKRGAELGKTKVFVKPDPFLKEVLEKRGLEGSKITFQDWMLQVAPQTKLDSKLRGKQSDLIQLKEWIVQLMNTAEFQLC